METPPTILFDLDGTLVDTADDLMAALNVVAASEGLAPIDRKTAVAMIGDGAAAMLRTTFDANGRAVSPERIEELIKAFIAYYAEHIADGSQPYPGTEAMLDRFAGNGWQLAVCTNKLEPLARRLLDRLDLGRRFPAISGQDTFGVKKPDPRHILETIRLAGGDPRRAIMVGDSHFDVEAAKAAGVPVVAVSFGYSRVPAAELGADTVIGHFDELWDAVQPLIRPTAP